MDCELKTDVPPALQGVSPQFIAAVQQRAEIHADLVARFLNSTSEMQTGKSRMSHSNLLQLAAIVQLLEWEQQGISTHLQVGLPSSREALECSIDPELREGKFPGWHSNEALLEAVLLFAIERIAWASQSEWGVDVVLSVINEEDLLDAMEELFSNLIANEHVLTGGDHHEE